MMAGLARLLYPPSFQPCCLSLAAFTSQLATRDWQLNSGMNRADHLVAAASPSNVDGSSAGLLLLGTLSIHQKEGRWTSIEKKAFIRSSMVGLLDRPLTTPPPAELLSTNKRTLRLCNSLFHCHLTGTMVRSSTWQIKWSPTRSFHNTRSSLWTWS